jgi:hypothetical protein
MFTARVFRALLQRSNHFTAIAATVVFDDDSSTGTPRIIR